MFNPTLETSWYMVIGGVTSSWPDQDMNKKKMMFAHLIRFREMD